MMNPTGRESMVNVGEGVELLVSQSLVDNPKAVVIIVHGLCEHCGRYDYVVSRLNDFGYSVYRYDHRGHGRSGGEKGYLDDFQLYTDDADKIVGLVKQECPNIPRFMLGHSMGGFITAAYGVNYPRQLTGQVFSGAAVILLPLFADLESLDFDAVAREPIPNDLGDIISRDREVVQAYADDPLVLKEFSTKLMGEVFIKGAKWIMENMAAYKYPCLILHGGDDRIVVPDASQYLHEHISSADKQIKIYQGLYHEILNEPEKDSVLEDIHQWIFSRV
jgi:acylglycerol lipase